MASRVRSWVRQTLFRALGAPFYRFGHLSFSQAGEDCVVRFLLKDRGLALPEVTYLDIGCRHPTAGSNTCLLYSAGARGVCVDADPTHLDLFRRIRPRDEVVHAGIAPRGGGTLPLYFMEGGGSTLDASEAAAREAGGRVRVARVEQVEVLDVNELIRTRFDAVPTFLSIDIESLDLPVLEALDLQQYPIPVICAETCRYSDTHVRAKDPAIARLLDGRGYEVYADTYINTIFVNRQWFHGS
jgi:hypothetical protein